MKQTTVNEFKDGLNLDLHPIVTPKTVLTDNLNGTFITYNGNEFCLQNDRGNKWVSNLTTGYTPIGIKEYNGVLYIVSVNGTQTEIGTYPSPNYSNITQADYEKEVSGKLEFVYRPLHVLENHNPLTNEDLGYTKETPVTIEIQPSYDGSVNLIIVADKVKPRIINSGFSVLPNDEYKFVNRNQKVQTNIYDNLSKESELIRNSDVLTNVDLIGVQSGGQWKGGNYTFYIKFGDADYNQTDVVAESGIVSVFNGNDGVPSTISGTVLDERTDKMIHLGIIGLNHVYSKIYVYFSREYSDTQGYRMTECGMLTDPIDMIEDKNVTYQDIWLTGFEQQTAVNIEELNVDYHTVDWARAETQHSNMLFLGNLGQEETFKLYQDLDKITKGVSVTVNQISLTAVNNQYSGGTEYYNTSNIYNYLGYYPGELYRFGIVYILKDGSKTPVFNMNGKNFQTGEDLPNGVFLMPNVDVIYSDVVKPIYLSFTLPTINNENVLGWFVVRQKRIPNTICEGLNIAIDRMSNVPVVWNGTDWITQSFLECPREKIPTWQNDEGSWSTVIDPATKKKHTRESWAGNGKIEEDVQLKYNNFNFNNVIFTEEGFQQWLTSKNYSYGDYWVSLNTAGNQYTADDMNSSYTTAEAGLEDATRKIAEKSKLDHEEYRDWNYTKIFILATDTPEEETFAQETLQNIMNGGAYAINWYQQYHYTGNVDEANNPIDEPTENYAISLNIVNGRTDYEGYKIHNSGGWNAILRSSWINQYKTTLNSTSLDNKILKEWNCPKYWKEANALLSLDPCVNQNVASILDGSKFNVNLERSAVVETENSNILINTNVSSVDDVFRLNDTKCVFVGSNTGSKVVDGYEFSNVAGSAASVERFKYFTFPDGVFEEERYEMFFALQGSLKNKPNIESLSEEEESNLQHLYRTNLNINLIRGLFTPYIGLANKTELPFGVYSIKHKNELGTNDFFVRQQDDSEYYTVSDYLYCNNRNTNVFRGDCFTNTVTMRIIRNFIDSTAPVSDVIVDPWGWKKWVIMKDMNSTEKDADDKESGPVRYDYVNLADVNTVDLGLWITFKCMSSYNLGLRALDYSHTEEMAMLGSPRSFHPVNSVSTSTGNKMEESFILNDGLSATVGRKRYDIFPEKAPYSKSEFANRIMFSNVNITDAFTNGYRTFQGLSYKDYDKQYGAITKLISLGQNIFVVMEHGLGLVPVNPKALMQTTTGEAIHIYGYGVLPDEMTIISQDFGSKYEHSVIRTPIGIYGVDTDACKVWRFSDKQGFETISDMKVETYLKEYHTNNSVCIGLSDVRTHYNARKGDIMFTFYEDDDISTVAETDYFNVSQKTINVGIGETKIIKCSTNLDDSLIHFENTENIECSYSNKTLEITGITEGAGNIRINGIDLTVTVTPEIEISISDFNYANVPDYPSTDWYVNNNTDDKAVYFHTHRVDTLYGMRISLPVFLRCPNGRPVSEKSNAAAYSIDRQRMVSVESENKSVIDVPADNHFASTRLYDQCNNYILPTIVHISEKCFKNTGSAKIRIYNKDKSEYDTCIVNVTNTNPEGTNVSEFKQKNLVWPYAIYTGTNCYFDVWYHHHLRHRQIITIDDPTAITLVENGYGLQDRIRNDSSIQALYRCDEFMTKNKPGVYHISFTCPPDDYYDYSGTYTVTVYVSDSIPTSSGDTPNVPYTPTIDQDPYKVVMSNVSFSNIPESIYADTVTENDIIHLDCDVTLYKLVNGQYVESNQWGNSKCQITYAYNKTFTVSNMNTSTYHISKDISLYDIVNQLYKKQLSVQTTIEGTTYKHVYKGDSNLVDVITSKLYIPVFYGSATSDKLTAVPTAAGDIRFSEDVDLLTNEFSSKFYIKYNSTNEISNTINASANENERFYIGLLEKYFGIDYGSIDIYDGSNNKIGRYIQPDKNDPMLLRSLSLKWLDDRYVTQDVLFFSYAEPQSINDTYTVKIKLDN